MQQTVEPQNIKTKTKQDKITAERRNRLIHITAEDFNTPPMTNIRNTSQKISKSIELTTQLTSRI